jgi:hypothetical protein
MIGELVLFSHPEGSTREEIVQDALKVVPKWQANPDLIRKHFMVSADNRQGAGFYIWPNREAAEKAHSPEWIARKEAETGSKVTITYFDLFLMLDNQTKTVTQA